MQNENPWYIQTAPHENELCPVPAEIIAAKIRLASAYCFDVSVGTIKQMRSSGVPDQIILAMVRRGERGGV